MPAEITVFVVNYNSSAFIELSLYALEKLTRRPFKVSIIDNGSKNSDYEELQRIVQKFSKRFPIHLQRMDHGLTGSLAHGTALNELCKSIDTPYFSILDADATWLIKNWDDLLIGKLSGDVKVIGTQAPVIKHLDFPLMFAILFETETFQMLKIDFRPADLEKYQDTGWELREKYLASGYQGISLPFRNTRTYKDGPFREVAGADEFYMDESSQEIIASHFGRGSNPFGKQSIRSSNPLLRLLLIPLNYLLWQRSKRLWIRISKSIINKQG